MLNRIKVNYLWNEINLLRDSLVLPFAGVPRFPGLVRAVCAGLPRLEVVVLVVDGGVQREAGRPEAGGAEGSGGLRSLTDVSCSNKLEKLTKSNLLRPRRRVSSVIIDEISVSLKEGSYFIILQPGTSGTFNSTITTGIFLILPLNFLRMKVNFFWESDSVIALFFPTIFWKHQFESKNKNFVFYLLENPEVFCSSWWGNPAVCCDSCPELLTPHLQLHLAGGSKLTNIKQISLGAPE